MLAYENVLSSARVNIDVRRLKRKMLSENWSRYPETTCHHSTVTTWRLQFVITAKGEHSNQRTSKMESTWWRELREIEHLRSLKTRHNWTISAVRCQSLGTSWKLSWLQMVWLQEPKTPCCPAEPSGHRRHRWKHRTARRLKQ